MKIKNQNLLKKLQKTGLSEKESVIYVALLELGGAYPSKIADYTGLNRSTVYMILTTMSIKGIVNEIKNKNKQFYQLEHPKKFLKFTKNKLNIIEDEIEEVIKMLPELEGVFNNSVYKPKVTFFEGIDGILDAYSTHVIVSKSYEMLAWANATELESTLPDKFFLWYRKEKERIGITTRGILPKTSQNVSFIDRVYKGIKKNIWPDIRYIEGSIFPYKAEITVYDQNKVSIITLVKDRLIGVVIEDETIYGLMKMIFELSWAGVKTK